MTTEPARARPGSGTAIVERVALSPVGSRRVEETLARLTALFGVLFGLQSLVALVAEWPLVATPLGLAQAVLLLGVVALAGLAAVLHHWTRTVFVAAAAVFVLCLATWPLAVHGPVPQGTAPWLLQLSGVACGFVVVATRSRVRALAGIAVVAAVGAGLRALPSGGGAVPATALLGGAFDVVVGLALLAIATAVRLAARSVDLAQTMALGRYADAQIDEATESERTRTDALVHDSVLTTFLSAAGAGTPEARSLAARMARNTMKVLSRATVASTVGPRVAVRDLLDRLRADAGPVGDAFGFDVRDVRDHFVPEPVADAVVSAAVQAMTNSVKHAGGAAVRRSVLVQGTDVGGVRVLVEDHGRGFDPAAVASERLGVRVSIFERMQRVGGEVDLDTAIGRGTSFVLSWPAAAHAPLERVGDEASVGA